MRRPSPRVATAAAVLATCVALLCAAACGDAEPPKPVGSSGSTSSSGLAGVPGGKDSGEDVEPEYVFDDGSGTGATWTSLYKDLFGPSGRAGCAGGGNACHLSQSSAGFARSSFVCATETGCRDSILGTSGLVKGSDVSAPQNAFLIGVLRRKKTDGSITGTQPKTPPFVFHEKSIDRIRTWIGNGASQ